MPHSLWVNLQEKDQGQFLTLHHSSSRLNLERRADPAIFKSGNVRPGLIRDKGADLPNHFSLACTEEDATPTSCPGNHDSGPWITSIHRHPLL